MDYSWKEPDIAVHYLGKHTENFYERPIKILDIKDKTIAHIVSQGVFIRLGAAKR
jgi:hypothetical protein